MDEAGNILEHEPSLTPLGVSRVFARIDQRIRSMMSLEQIIIQVERDGPLINRLRGAMEKVGWRIDVVSHGKGWVKCGT